MKYITLYFLFFFTSTLNAQTPNVIRGPYLQSPGPNSIVIRWRTDTATDSRVTYGLSFGSATFTEDSNTSTTEHRVQLNGLLAHTQYYYTIGSTAQILRGPDSLMQFTTAPNPLTPTPVRLWVTGDMGHGNDGQAVVRESYLAHAAATQRADLWLWLGDNVYYDGTDAEFQAKVFDSIYGYHHLFPNLPFASTSGNHDYNSICPWQGPCLIDPELHAGPYLDIIDPPTKGELGGVPSNRKIFYSFDYGDIHFISLNSEIGSQTAAYDWLGMTDFDTTFTSPMIEWLKADLAASTKKWKIAFWHQPPYSVEPQLTEWQPYCVAARQHFNPILEQYGVDLVLGGHDHSYQRSYLINGHYGRRSSFNPAKMMINGTSGNDALGEAYVKYTDGPLAGRGTVYVIEGNSSSNSSYTPVADPVMYNKQLCDSCIGSLFIDIDGDRLDAHFLSAYYGIRDQFTILKQSVTGIRDEQNPSHGTAVYPNPFNENARIEFYASEAGSYQLELIDLLGKKILSESINVTTSGKQEFHLDALQLHLAKGSYVAKIAGKGAGTFVSMVKM